MAGAWDAAPWPGPGGQGAWDAAPRPALGGPGRAKTPDGSVWGTPSRPTTGCGGPPRTEVANTTTERAPIETDEHGLAIAVHPKYVAMILSAQPDTISVMPLPSQLVRRPGSSLGLGTPSGGRGGSRSSCGRPASSPAARRVTAPTGPLQALRFADGSTRAGADPGPPLLLAAASLEAYIWDVSSAQPTLLCTVGVQVPPPTLPALAFDETGSIAAVGGFGCQGLPHLDVFRTRDGVSLSRAVVPPLTVGMQSDEGTAVTITACGFLRGELAFALVVAVHDGGSDGRALIYDMRGCAQSGQDGFQAKHEADGLPGGPFRCLSPHHAQDSMFLLGGEGRVHLMQVRETGGGGLTCTRSTEIALGGGSVPCWLSSGPAESQLDNSDRDESEGPVLALGVVGCRVPGGPLSFGLAGTAALAVVPGSLHVVWGHRKQADRAGGTPPLGGAAVCTVGDGTTLLAAYLSAFDAGGEVVRLALDPELHMAPGEEPEADMGCSLTDLLSGPVDGDMSDPPMCSVMPLGPIPDDSALGRALTPGRCISRTAPAATAGGGRPPPGAARRAGSAPRDRGPRPGANQPVTFHRKVKSAGYGPPTEPPRQSGRPKINSRPAGKPDFGPPSPSKGSRPPRPRSASGGGGGGRGGLVGGGAPLRSGPPLEPCPEHTLPAYEGAAVIDLCFTPQATHLCVAGSDRTISAYRLPLGRGRASGGGAPKALGLTGHQADITSLCPSFTDCHSTGGGGGPLLLSAATDRTARLWALGGTHAGHDLMVFDRLRTNTKPMHKEENPALEQVQDVQFLCMDGAIVLATGNRLGIYRYELHAQDTSDDIKRLQRLGSYKCTGMLSLPKEPGVGQSITAIAANNALLSGTMLVASSSKKIYAWDVAAEKVLACADDASLHLRPITSLRLAQPHDGCQSAQSMDIFYTSSMDGSVKFWDLRCMQACRVFEGGHTHSCQRLKSCLSPCLRYLCTPSEDGVVCVYDVRMGSILGGRRTHRDVASAVDIHPRTGTLASGGFDGSVCFSRAPPAKQPKGQGRPGGGMVERHSAERARETGLREVEMDLAF